MAFGDYIQGNSFDNAAGGSGAYPGAVSAGNFLVAVVRVGALAATVSVSDSVNGSWVEARNQAQSTDGHTGYVFYKLGTAAGTPTVTVTASAGTKRSCIGEYAAAGNTLALDQVNSAQGAALPLSSGNITTTVATELVVGGVTDNNSAGTNLSWTASGSYTADVQLNPGVGFDHPVALYHQALASTATLDFSPVRTGGSAPANLTALVASFNTVAAPTGVDPGAIQVTAQRRWR